MASIALVVAPVVVPAVAAEPTAVDVSASTVVNGANADTGIVQAAAVVGFDAENIISDTLFYDGAAMTAAEIQSFLDAKIGTCRNGKCLNVLTAGITSRDAVYSQTTGNLICSAIQGGTMKVSELIYRVQVACGISAKVILVTLQKEQGLTTSKEPSDWNLKAAMGASCPDTAPCDPAFAGVGPQILKGTQQLKTYKAANFAKQPGRNWIGYNPNAACGGTTLNIQNYATAALYNYTPYQPNAAALAAGYGLGDGCSSYGNRNFYNYYTQWFGSTQRNVCDQPPYTQVRGASGIMAAAADVPARATADENCNVGAVWLPKGMTVSVSAEFGEWYWVDVNGTMYWMRKAHLVTYDPCTQPPYGEVSGAGGTYVTSAILTARASANDSCTAGARDLPAGSEVIRAATWKEWSWVSVKGTMYWVKSSQLTVAPSTCTQPRYEQVTGASGTFKAAASTARTAPADGCATGAVAVSAGTKVTAGAAWGDWYWVNVSGAMLWMRKADLAAVQTCNQPPYEQVTGASGMFTTSGAVDARTAPDAGCATDARSLPAGTAVKVVAAWSDWYWAEYDGHNYWIRKDALSAVTCTQPRYEEVRGAAGTKQVASATTGRSAPSTTCTVGTALPAGASVTLAAEWSDWYWVQSGSDMLWVPKSALTDPGTMVTTTAALNLRSGPGTTYGILAVIPSGVAVRQVGASGDWRQVVYGGTTGWVSAAYVR